MSTSDPSGEALIRLAQQSQRHALRSRKRKLARCAGNAFGQSAKAQASGRAPQQKVGDHFEEVAWRLLKRAGCTLLARQLACPLGELDLVVREGVQLVFVEVRRRGSEQAAALHKGGPMVAADTRATVLRGSTPTLQAGRDRFRTRRGLLASRCRALGSG